jgi:hypothetical protein
VVQIALDGTGIDAIICQFEAAAMPQHMRVNLHIEPGSLGCASHHGLKDIRCIVCGKSPITEAGRSLVASLFNTRNLSSPA